MATSGKGSMTAESRMIGVEERPVAAMTGQDLLRSLRTPTSRLACVVLAGGQGVRLFPLTKFRCKPAILFGGRYRLIDVPLSNALHAGISKIFVATQFLSRSLHKHLFQTYKKEFLHDGFVEVLSAEQRPNSSEWYRGTADAVRQNLEYLLESDAEYFLILSGDQLYRLNFVDMFQAFLEKDVDVLVATIAVAEKDAPRLGIMKINEDGRIIDFCEKPSAPSVLKRMSTSASIMSNMPFPQDASKKFLASMGIYLFRKEALRAALDNDPRDDFGKHLIPSLVQSGRAGAYLHTGYWEDIGTVESFYMANMALTRQHPEFECYSDEFPIFSLPHHLPGPRIFSADISSSMISEGSIVEGSRISSSILGQRSVVRKDTEISDSYLMGNDAYTVGKEEKTSFEIGEGSVIHKAIIDRNVHIGKRVRLVNKNGLLHFDSDIVSIRDGIIVVPQGTTVPDDFSL